MKSHILIFLLLGTSCSADTFFAPYEGPFPVALDTRFDGVVIHRPRYDDDVKDVFNFSFKGYIRLGKGFFEKIGTEIISLKVPDRGWHERCLIQRAGVDLQFGYYWQNVGALRLGLFANGPGIGGDYWLMHNRFKWLTTLELSGNSLHGAFDYDTKLRFLVKWLNRVFVFGGTYISFGVYHIGDAKGIDRAQTQAFLGFGAAI